MRKLTLPPSAIFIYDSLCYIDQTTRFVDQIWSNNDQWMTYAAYWIFVKGRLTFMRWITLKLISWNIKPAELLWDTDMNSLRFPRKHSTHRWSQQNFVVRFLGTDWVETAFQNVFLKISLPIKLARSIILFGVSTGVFTLNSKNKLQKMLFDLSSPFVRPLYFRLLLLSDTMMIF